VYSKFDIKETSAQMRMELDFWAFEQISGNLRNSISVWMSVKIRHKFIMIICSPSRFKLQIDL